VSPRARRLLAVAAAAVLAWGARSMLDSVVRQMLYPAPPVRVPSPPPRPLVEVPLEAGGRAVSAWFQPPASGGGRAGDAASAAGTLAPLGLMRHGNGENLETMRQAGLFRDFAAAGAGVLAIDYPGYGRSAGTPSEEANLAAAEAAWEWLRGNAEGRPRVAAGWSLGAALAAQLAARDADDVAGVMLLSPWDRLDEVARLHFPGWMVGALLSERYDSAAAAPRIAAPALVVHGDRDPIIPIALGRRLFDALPEPKRWVEVHGAGHNDLLAHPEAWQAIAAFLRERAAPSGG
jgi:hypothetical protein